MYGVLFDLEERLYSAVTPVSIDQQLPLFSFHPVIGDLLPLYLVNDPSS
jgi:hypothetical protein